LNKEAAINRSFSRGMPFEKDYMLVKFINKNYKNMTYVKFKNPLEKSINNIVGELFNDLPVMFNENFIKTTKQGDAPVNIKETGNSYVVDVVAPGLDKNDFKVSLDGNILTISAEKQNEMIEDTGKQIHREYSYRSFKRSFTIDEKIDATAIEASYVNGVLRLNLPKREEVKETSKEIKVN
jgi:HSP20 family protein